MEAENADLKKESPPKCFVYSWGFFAPQKINVYIICLEDCFAFGITCMFRCCLGAELETYFCVGGVGVEIHFFHQTPEPL